VANFAGFAKTGKGKKFALKYPVGQFEICPSDLVLADYRTNGDG